MRTSSGAGVQGLLTFWDMFESLEGNEPFFHAEVRGVEGLEVPQFFCLRIALSGLDLPRDCDLVLYLDLPDLDLSALKIRGHGAFFFFARGLDPDLDPGHPFFDYDPCLNLSCLAQSESFCECHHSRLQVAL